MDSETGLTSDRLRENEKTTCEAVLMLLSLRWLSVNPSTDEVEKVKHINASLD